MYIASLKGGALYCGTDCSILFFESSNVTFTNNRATYGGALSSSGYSNISFGGYSMVSFFNNEATKRVAK